MIGFISTDRDVSFFNEMLADALRRSGDTHDVVDILDAVARSEAQIWVNADAMFVTQVEQSPKKRRLRYWLAVGNISDLEPLVPIIETFGREQGCTEAVADFARRGWIKVMPEGWHEEKVRTYTKVL